MAQATRKNPRRAAPARRPGSSSATSSTRKATVFQKPGDRRGKRRANGRRRSDGHSPSAIPRARVDGSRSAPVLAVDASSLPLNPIDGLTEEQQIGSAKYTTGEQRPRVFEEERFIFPDTYGTDRVRLMVKDPEWLFAFWDVNPSTWTSMRSRLGERGAALSRLTLKVSDTASGGDQVILLPGHARAWYVRADTGRRTYQAELGFTLPSGEFQSIARSNTVLTPWLGASSQKARLVASYDRPFTGARGDSPSSDSEPWRTEPVVGGPLASAKNTQERGGASDRYRR